MSEHREPIPSMIYNAAVGGHVTNSQQIIDENENKEQSQINVELRQNLGQGGSVDARIAAAKSEIKGNATSACDTLGKAEALISAENTRAQTVEEQLRTLYNSLQQSKPIPVTSLPATGEAGKIYRLAGTTSYADYMYAEGALTTPVKMAEYNNAIDDEPTAGSNNLVKSGGVVNLLKYLLKKETKTSNTTYPISLLGLNAGTKYVIYIKTASLSQTEGIGIGYYPSIGDYYIVQNISAAQFNAGITIEFTPSTSGTLTFRTEAIGITFTYEISVAGLQNTLDSILNNCWENKNVVVYGDSIVGLGNGDNPGNGSFMYWASKQHRFKNLFARGVGGQTFTWNTLGWYTAVGTNGNYLNRAVFDSNGNVIATEFNVETITQTDIANIESHYDCQIETHYGAFCSWDRIKAMVPADIRTTIDLVIINGGTNDGTSINHSEYTEPEWQNGNGTDVIWAADSTFYNGGDYDITTFEGAIASTIMKFMIWCPNAVIILSTPFPRFGANNQIYVNTNNVKFSDVCDIEKNVARCCGAEIIDANTESNIIGTKFANYVSDGLHPNLDGRKMYGRVFIGELYRIANKILD